MHLPAMGQSLLLKHGLILHSLSIAQDDPVPQSMLVLHDCPSGEPHQPGLLLTQRAPQAHTLAWLHT